MINVGFFYNVIPGKNSEFEKSFESVIEYLRANVDGFVSAVLYRDVMKPDEYMIFSEWKDGDAFREFTTSRPFFDTTNSGKSLLATKPRHVVLKGYNQ
jgi:heme-degrading monooxygenase HmoA